MSCYSIPIMFLKYAVKEKCDTEGIIDVISKYNEYDDLLAYYVCTSPVIDPGVIEELTTIFDIDKQSLVLAGYKDDGHLLTSEQIDRGMRRLIYLQQSDV